MSFVKLSSRGIEQYKTKKIDFVVIKKTINWLSLENKYTRFQNWYYIPWEMSTPSFDPLRDKADHLVSRCARYNFQIRSK